MSKKKRKMLRDAARQEFPDAPESEPHPQFWDRWESGRCPNCGGVDIVILARSWPLELAACTACDADEIAARRAVGRA